MTEVDFAICHPKTMKLSKTEIKCGAKAFMKVLGSIGLPKKILSYGGTNLLLT